MGIEVEQKKKSVSPKKATCMVVYWKLFAPSGLWVGASARDCGLIPSHGLSLDCGRWHWARQMNG